MAVILCSGFIISNKKLFVIDTEFHFNEFKRSSSFLNPTFVSSTDFIVVQLILSTDSSAILVPFFKQSRTKRGN